MKTAKINRIVAKNIKGVATFDTLFSGRSAEIVAENGAGKTTIADIYCWVFNDTDSCGVPRPNFQPLDINNQPVVGLVQSAEFEMDFDGDVDIIRKEIHQKTKDGKIVGYDTFRYINGVGKKVDEFDTYIKDKMPQAEYLTDIRRFCTSEKQGGIHWTKRREMLLEIAGDMGVPSGFDELLAAMGKRTPDEYKKVLADEIKRLEIKLADTKPRIDEKKTEVSQYKIADNIPALTATKDSINAEIEQLSTDRLNIIAQEKARQSKIDNINTLQTKLSKREGELKSDLSAVKLLIDEKQAVGANCDVINAKINKLGFDEQTAEALLASKKKMLDNLNASMAAIRSQYNAVCDHTDSTICVTCGQPLPDDMISQAADSKATRLSELDAQGRQMFDQSQALIAEIQTIELQIIQLGFDRNIAKQELSDAMALRDKRLAEIESAIQASPRPLPENDKQWLDIKSHITTLQSEIGTPVSEQITAIDGKKAQLYAQLCGVQNSLADYDNYQKAVSRVAELEAEEKKLCQNIADNKRLKDSLDQYNKAVSERIETSVNAKFGKVTFKLFKTNFSGGYEPICEIIYDGRPYDSCSSGEKIIIGLDIIKTLGDYYEARLPLFIDNAEQFTGTIESESQTISLFARKSFYDASGNYNDYRNLTIYLN